MTFCRTQASKQSCDNSAMPPITPETAHSAEKPSSALAILRQLYLLRNITITFITLMAVFAYFGLGIRLPLIPLTVILVIMAVTNLITRLTIDAKQAPNLNIIFFQLLVEIGSFSLILYFAGGATNPFTFFYLIPLAISATVIPGRRTWILTGLTLLLYSLLLKYYVPLGYQMHDHSMAPGSDSQFNQHVIGMWFGFIVSAMLVTWFITYLARELKRRDEAIYEASQRELKDQQMVSLGTLAAGTAHELGTPLASLAIVAEDLTDGYDPETDADLYANQEILCQQISRCKDILSVLSESAGASRANEGYLMPPMEFIQHTLRHWRTQRPHAKHELKEDSSHEAAGQVLYDTTLLQSVTNLLNNAADACNEPIGIAVSCSDNRLRISIHDCGPGLTEEQLAVAGDAGFSSKPEGLGIGLFLAINTIKRSGGTVRFKAHDQQGTITLVELPLIQQSIGRIQPK